MNGECPFLSSKCKCGHWTCSAGESRMKVDKDNCGDFLDCMNYEEKMVKVNKML